MNPTQPHGTAVFLLGSLSGLSGGDMHALRLVDWWEGRDPGTISLVTSEDIAAKLPPRSRDSARVLRTPLDGRSLSMPAYALNVSLRSALALLRTPRLDVAIASSHFFQDTIPCVVRHRLHGTRVVAYVYHLVEKERQPVDLRSRVSVWLERFSLRLLLQSDAVLLVDNAETSALLRRRGFARPALRGTRNAYDPWERMPKRVPGGRPTMVFCGRLTEEKGVWDALETARRIGQARLLMLGDGPLRRALATRITELGLENVELRGYVSEQEKWAVLRSAHVFIAPSREEGWGIAVGEALTADVPAVVYDLPAYAHFGSRVLRVPLGDVDALVGAVTAAIDHPQALPRTGPALDRWDDVLASDRRAMLALVTPEREMLKEAPPRWRRIASGIRRNGLIPTLASLSRWGFGYAASFVRRPDGAFEYQGERYRYHISRVGRTWMTERGVELPVFESLVRNAGDQARVLEVGRTLNGYFAGLKHTVVDKYDPHDDAISVDVLDYQPSDGFDLIIAVSTLEHVGWDEEPRDPKKALRAIEHLTALLAPNGILFFDFPVGVHPELDAAAETGHLPVEGCMRRVATTNAWEQTTWEGAAGSAYDLTIGRANAIAFVRIAASARS